VERAREDSMAFSTEFFVEQFQEDQEAWKPDHVQAMECYEIQDKLRPGLRTFRMIRDADDIWSRKVQSGAVPFDPGRARLIRSMYEWWIRPCDGLLSQIEKLEKADFVVEGAEELRKARQFARAVLRMPIDDIIHGMSEKLISAT
jgi:hypothetical protein